MTQYKLLKSGAILRDGKDSIPADTRNADYIQYLEWLLLGHTPEPVETADETVAREAVELIEQALASLEKTDDVAVRCFKAGTAFPQSWQDYVTALRAVVNGGSGPLPAMPSYP